MERTLFTCKRGFRSYTKEHDLEIMDIITTLNRSIERDESHIQVPDKILVTYKSISPDKISILNINTFEPTVLTDPVFTIETKSKKGDISIVIEIPSSVSLENYIVVIQKHSKSNDFFSIIYGTNYNTVLSEAKEVITDMIRIILTGATTDPAMSMIFSLDDDIGGLEFYDFIDRGGFIDFVDNWRNCFLSHPNNPELGYPDPFATLFPLETGEFPFKGRGDYVSFSFFGPTIEK